MADKKISALTAATTPLAGTEVLPIVQSGATVKVAVSDLTAGRAISATAVTATTGNFVVGTSGQGVDFSATPGTGTSELLADYEEGTWSPTLEAESGSFGAITYNALNGGRYIKVGSIVHVQAVLYTDSVAVGTATLEVRVAGLPFTSVTSSGTTQNGISSLAISQSSLWVVNQPTGALVRANSTQVGLFYRLTANGASTAMTVSEVTTGSTGNFIRIAGTYVAA